MLILPEEDSEDLAACAALRQEQRQEQRRKKRKRTQGITIQPKFLRLEGEEAEAAAG